MTANEGLPDYQPPALTELGSVPALTLAPCKPKHEGLVPGHVWDYFCADGTLVVVTSA